MRVHLIKIAVGIDSIQHLADVQKSRKRGGPKAVYHFTRFMPKRVDDVLDGGSMYWIVKGMIAVRQRIVGLEMVQLEGKDGQHCGIKMERVQVGDRLIHHGRLHRLPFAIGGVQLHRQLTQPFLRTTQQ